MSAAVGMGVQPSEFLALTPSDLFEIQEGFIERHGGMSHRARVAGLARFKELKRQYPDGEV